MSSLTPSQSFQASRLSTNEQDLGNGPTDFHPKTSTSDWCVVSRRAGSGASFQESNSTTTTVVLVFASDLLSQGTRHDRRNWLLPAAAAPQSTVTRDSRKISANSSAFRSRELEFGAGIAPQSDLAWLISNFFRHLQGYYYS